MTYKKFISYILIITVICASGFIFAYGDDSSIIEINLTKEGKEGGALFDGGMLLAPGVSYKGTMRINNQTGNTVTIRSLVLSNVVVRDKEGNIITSESVNVNSDGEKSPYDAFTKNIEFAINVKFAGLIPYTKTIILNEWINNPLELGISSTKIKNGQSVDINFTVKMLGGAGNAAQGVSAKANIIAMMAGEKDQEEPSFKQTKDKDDSDYDSRSTAATKEPEKPKHIHIFNDIDDHWAEEYIHQLGCEYGYVNGFGDGTFRPDRNITRDEATKIIVLVKQLEVEEGSTKYIDELFFEKWAKKYIYTATKNGVVKGYPGWRFRAKRQISRDESVAMIVRAFYEDRQEDPEDLSGIFTDEKAFPSWSKGYLSTAYKEGIINGYPDGSFKPLGKITRAEFVSIIVRYLDK